MILQRPCPPSNAGPPIESVLEDIGPRPVIVDRPESQPDEPENIPPESSGGQDVENVLDDIEPVRPGEPARPAEEAPQPITEPVLFEGGCSEEHKSELQSIMSISYAVFCL